MLLAYPVTLKTYANGQVGASFPDVPEAMTAGDSKPAAKIGRASCRERVSLVV